MSVGSNIILADAAGTPVNKTFTWSGQDAKGVSHWFDRSGGIPLGYGHIDISHRSSRSSKRTAAGAQAVSVSRTIMTLSRPVMETLGTETSTGIPPAPTVSHVPFAKVEFITPDRSASYDRATLLKMLGNLCLNSQIIAAVVDYDQPR